MAKAIKEKAKPEKAKLIWSQSTEYEWLAPCDNHGARVRKLKNGYLSKEGEPRRTDETFHAYRDGHYLGAEKSLKAAQGRCERNENSPTYLQDKTELGTPAFLRISKAEGKSMWALHDEKMRLKNQQQPQRGFGGIVDMTQYLDMTLEQLVRAYNESVEVAISKGLDRYKPVSTFKDKDVALKAVEMIESSIKAQREGERTAKKQKGPEVKPDPVQPKAKPAPRVTKDKPVEEEAAPEPAAKKGRAGKAAPSPAPAKASAAPSRKGKTIATPEDFVTAINGRAGTNIAKLAAFLFAKLNKAVPMKDAMKHIYGKETDAIVNVIGNIKRSVGENDLPYEVRKKDGTIGIFAQGK